MYESIIERLLEEGIIDEQYAEVFYSKTGQEQRQLLVEVIKTQNPIIRDREGTVVREIDINEILPLLAEQYSITFPGYGEKIESKYLDRYFQEPITEDTLYQKEDGTWTGDKTVIYERRPEYQDESVEDVEDLEEPVDEEDKPKSAADQVEYWINKGKVITPEEERAMWNKPFDTLTGEQWEKYVYFKTQAKDDGSLKYTTEEAYQMATGEFETGDTTPWGDWKKGTGEDVFYGYAKDPKSGDFLRRDGLLVPMTKQPEGIYWGDDENTGGMLGGAPGEEFLNHIMASSRPFLNQIKNDLIKNGIADEDDFGTGDTWPQAARAILSSILETTAGSYGHVIKGSQEYIDIRANRPAQWGQYTDTITDEELSFSYALLAQGIRDYSGLQDITVEAKRSERETLMRGSPTYAPLSSTEMNSVFKDAFREIVGRDPYEDEMIEYTNGLKHSYDTKFKQDLDRYTLSLYDNEISKGLAIQRYGMNIDSSYSQEAGISMINPLAELHASIEEGEADEIQRNEDGQRKRNQQRNIIQLMTERM